LELFAFETRCDEPRHVRALGELPQSVRESAAPRLIRAQRHHRAARLGQSLASEVANARKDHTERRVLRKLLLVRLLSRTELHQDPREGLSETVVDLLPDAVAFHEHRSRLCGAREARQLDGERGLLSERDEELAALDVDRLVAREREPYAPDRAPTEDERQHEQARVTVPAQIVDRLGPEHLRVVLDVDLKRAARLLEKSAQH